VVRLQHGLESVDLELAGARVQGVHEAHGLLVGGGLVILLVKVLETDVRNAGHCDGADDADRGEDGEPSGDRPGEIERHDCSPSMTTRSGQAATARSTSRASRSWLSSLYAPCRNSREGPVNVSGGSSNCSSSTSITAPMLSTSSA